MGENYVVRICLDSACFGWILRLFAAFLSVYRRKSLAFPVFSDVFNCK